MKIKRKPVMAAYAPIIGRDLEWFEADVKSYIGKNVASLRKFLKDQDFKCDFTAMDVYGPDTGSETWVLMTEAGKVKVNFVYDSKSVNRPRPKGDTSFSALRNANAGKRIEGGVTSAYVVDEQDPDAIAAEEERLFSSTRFNSGKRPVKAADDPNYGDITDLAEESAYSYVVQARNEFASLLSFVDDILRDEFGSSYDTAGTVSYGGHGSAIFTITPKCDGEWLDDYALNIYYDVYGVEVTGFLGRPYRMVVKPAINDDVIAYGNSFDDIQVEVAQDIAESCRVHYEEDVTML